jgi:EF-P beta-lysylation protein EpmB
MYIYFEMIFPEKFSDYYASKFKDGDCPLRRQAEYSKEEEVKHRFSKNDPVGDKNAEIEAGILQKYKGRLLVLASGECAINCRFCFRRNMRHQKYKDMPQRIANVLEKDKTIKEVILSGGEPLMLKNGELRAIFKIIPKSVNIRIHSRMPVVSPGRFSYILLDMLRSLGKRLVFVNHINHPNELDEESEKIFRYIAAGRVKVLNQSVLLKGVNDSPEILAELSERLSSQGVLPYYLHQLDRAQGSMHFEVPIKRAKAIFAELKSLLPGYLVPRFVREIKGKSSKTWIA